jgi:hypothetical protein
VSDFRCTTNAYTLACIRYVFYSLRSLMIPVLTLLHCLTNQERGAVASTKKEAGRMGVKKESTKMGEPIFSHER